MSAEKRAARELEAKRGQRSGSRAAEAGFVRDGLNAGSAA